MDIKKILLIIMLFSTVKPYEFVCNVDHEMLCECCSLHRSMFIEEVIPNTRNFITVSLGSNCCPASNTRQNDVRSFAFPFDWCVTPYQALYHFIENDFKDYLKLEHLIASSPLYFNQATKDVLAQIGSAHESENKIWVLDKKTGMIYNHDFTGNSQSLIENEHPEQYTKYQRRIKRFYEAMHSHKHIYFIRFNNITKKESIKLYQLLKKKFPTASFSLIVINVLQEFHRPWNIPHIYNYFNGGYQDFWKELCNKMVQGQLL